MKEGNGISPELESTVAIIEGMGFQVVEAQSRQLRSSTQVVFFIYRSGGVTLEDCTNVYRTVMPRLEVVLDSRDISLEVSSPGISRTIKYFREFSIFQGAKVRLMEAGENDWIEGIIASADEQKMVLSSEAGERSYTREEITKAKISEG